jgi:hypothetical protein
MYLSKKKYILLWKRLTKIYKKPKKLFLYILNFKIFRFIPDKTFLKMKYWLRIGKKLNLSNPKTFNEKLQWLKLYDRNPKYTDLVDKDKVREYIAKTIGEEYLIPLLEVYDSYEEIDFDKLPNQFVLKCTHDSGGLVICKNKNEFDIESARKKMNKSLKRNFYYHGREWCYKNIKPKIICEKYMVDESGVELKDYKIFCFNGEPKIIQVDYNRFIGHKRNLYDTQWNYIPASIQYPTDPEVKIMKPEKLNEMLKLAKVLAKDYPHVRVDFYSINEKIYFGEMTFYHGSGFERFKPESLGRKMGNWIKLPDEN